MMCYVFQGDLLVLKLTVNVLPQGKIKNFISNPNCNYNSLHYAIGQQQHIYMKTDMKNLCDMLMHYWPNFIVITFLIGWIQYKNI